MCGQQLCRNLTPAHIYLVSLQGPGHRRGQTEPRPFCWSLGEMVKLPESVALFVKWDNSSHTTEL